ncbi:MAG: hypothetical protein ACRDO4_12355 [Nocardioides sp.]
MTGGDQASDVDPFDLPEWLCGDDVVWESEEGLRSGHLVAGLLVGPGDDHLSCALLAVDEAYPSPVVSDDVRTKAHQSWRHGQVLLVERSGRLTLAVPGRRFDADLVLDAMTRLAKAVGASPDGWAVRLRLGSAGR